MAERIHVRAKDTGHEFVIWDDQFNEQVYEKTEKPAYGSDGEPVPFKPKTTVDESAAAKKTVSGQKAESTKEKS